MNKFYTYKGYHGCICYSADDDTYYGKIEFIRSLVTYESDALNTLKQSFENAVDHYLEHCNTTDTPPETPFRGTFNVRVGSDLHRHAAEIAHQKGLKLNHIVKEALQSYVEQYQRQEAL